MYIPLEEQSTDSQLNKFLFGEEYDNIIDYDNIMDNSYTKFNIFSLNKNEDEDEESKNYKILPLKEKLDLSKKNENIFLDINYISNKEKEKSENNINKIENS